MFADRAKIYVRSGKGGDGHVSFRREKYVPAGGPDGGDGGHGGDVIFIVDEGLNTLTDFRHVGKYKAGDGQEGGKKNCRGKDGDDMTRKCLFCVFPSAFHVTHPRSIRCSVPPSSSFFIRGLMSCPILRSRARSLLEPVGI